MDKTDNTPDANFFSGTVPMARINGAEIRRLRESKGLTQLYMATVIGVTTDTISRWENRRYPSIKLDNAERLAQALEVGLEAILEQELTDVPSGIEPLKAEVEDPTLVKLTTPSAQSADPTTPADQHRRSFLPWLLPIVLLVSLGGLALWKTKPASPRMPVAAERILPDHIPAGQTFPVLIRVTTNQQATVSFILKEIIPPGCRVVNSEPPLTSDASKNSSLNWISRTDKQTTTFAYLVQAPSKKIFGDQLRFSGGVRLSQGDQMQAEITGATTMEIAPFHWADVDRNNKIDDDEILAVYDHYSALTQIDYDRDFIDGIWVGSGYLWDRKTGKFVVQN